MSYNDSTARINQAAVGAQIRQESEQASNRGGCATGVLKANLYYPPSIRERVEKARAGAQQAIRQAQTAERIAQILDQHPEFGELLDLIARF